MKQMLKLLWLKCHHREILEFINRLATIFYTPLGSQVRIGLFEAAHCWANMGVLVVCAHALWELSGG